MHTCDTCDGLQQNGRPLTDVDHTVVFKNDKCHSRRPYTTLFVNQQSTVCLLSHPLICILLPTDSQQNWQTTAIRLVNNRTVQFVIVAAYQT